jgi:GNAT superfamily N-acetyltransferase
MTRIEIRPMQAGDSAPVAGLSGQLGYPATPAQIEERFRRIAQDRDATVLVALGADNRILGWIHASGTEDLASDRHAEVRALVVDADARGRGAGGALLAAAERWATGQGYGAMRVRSNTVRTEARRFYERAGYRVTKTQNHFHKALT